MTNYQRITPAEYQKEIKNILNISIDGVTSSSPSDWINSGLSLYHVVNSEKKYAQVLTLSGNILYQSNKVNIETLVPAKNTENDKEHYYQQIKKIKTIILDNHSSITQLFFENENATVHIDFSDGSKIKVFAQDSKPLSYEDTAAGYSVLYGSNKSTNKSEDYYRVIFTF